MLAAELAEFLAPRLAIPVGTVADKIRALRAHGLFSIGKQGPGRGSSVTDTDAINALLALLIDHGRGASVAANVTSLRSIPLAETIDTTPNWASELNFTRARSFGAMSDAFLHGWRSGELTEFEAQGSRLDAVISFNAQDREAYLAMSRERMIDGQRSWHFRRGTVKQSIIRRDVKIDGDLFRQLATGLGPP